MKKNTFFLFGIAALLTAAIFIFAGCGFGGSGGGFDDYGGGSPAYVLVDPTNPSIAAKFGVSTASKAFDDLHDLISTPLGTDDFTTIIRPGDYIDLETLTVFGYPNNTTVPNDGYINLTSTVMSARPGTANPAGPSPRTRLIVVGINSFKANGSYPGVSGAPNHVVFQFQDVPGQRNMNPGPNTNAGGYSASEMRTYLTGNFLKGLKTAAGLTNAMLWAPERYIGAESGVGTAYTVTDTLWLPTEWELFGSVFSAPLETATNQARLAYYGSTGLRIKYDGSSLTWYWNASPNSATAIDFCRVGNDGGTGNRTASTATGCAPAFCVQ